MLSITISGEEFWDQEAEEFKTPNAFVLELEHSLVSLSKWESKFQKPFLSNEPKTPEEVVFYLECMIINPIFPRGVISELSREQFEKVHEYIQSAESATTFGEMPERKGRGETITSELIYYWMVAFNIPFECQYWHLNRLFALVRICNIKNSPKQANKMSKAEMARQRRELNAKRKAQYGTKG